MFSSISETQKHRWFRGLVSMLAVAAVCMVWLDPLYLEGELPGSLEPDSNEFSRVDETSSGAGEEAAAESLSAADFEVRLRRREEPAAAAASAPLQASSGSATRKSKTGFRLVATIIEPGNSYAMISDEDGAMETCQLGSELRLRPSGYFLEDIQTRSVTITSNGTRERLELKRATEADTAGMKSGAGGTGTSGGKTVKGSGNGDTEERPVGISFDGKVPKGGFDSIESELEWLSGPDQNKEQGSAESKGSGQ
ncbi:MAG: hypothetical protein AAGG44_05310 [Planctomycetota bacterium]